MDAPAQWLVPTLRFCLGTGRGAAGSRSLSALSGLVALTLTSTSPEVPSTCRSRMYARRTRDDETEPWQDFDPRRGERTGGVAVSPPCDGGYRRCKACLSCRRARARIPHPREIPRPPPGE